MRRSSNRRLESIHSSAHSPVDEPEEEPERDGPPMIPRGPNDDAEIDWQEIDIGNRGPRAPFPFLIQDRQGFWRPYMLWCPENEDRDLETAWIAGHWQVQTWRVNLQRAEPELEDYYGVEALTLAYCLPTVADLTGGGKGIKLRSRSSRHRRDRRTAVTRQDTEHAEKADDAARTGQRSLTRRESKKEGKRTLSSEQEWEALSERSAAAAHAAVDTLTHKDAPWLLSSEGQYRCLLCRRWVTPEHMNSKGHKKALSWFAQASEEQRADFLMQRRRAFRIKQLAASGGGSGSVSGSKQAGRQSQSTLHSQEEDMHHATVAKDEVVRGTKRTRAGEKLDKVIAFLKKTTEECEAEKERLRRKRAQRGSLTQRLSDVEASGASGSCAACVQWDARQTGSIKSQQSMSHRGASDGDGDGDCEEGTLQDVDTAPLSETLPFEGGLGVGEVGEASDAPTQRSDEGLTVERWEIMKYDQDHLNRDCMWLEATDENLPAQGIWEQVRVHMIWGSFTFRFPGHWSHRDVAECLAHFLPANAVISIAHSSGNAYITHLMDCHLEDIRPEVLALIWNEETPLFWGGGRGQQDEQVGKALNHIRRFQIGMLEPQHMRILLQAKPQLADKVLRMDEAQPVTKLLRRAASQARLPIAEKKMDSDRPRSASPGRPSGGRGGASSAGKGAAGGKGAGGVSPIRSTGQAATSNSKGKGGAVSKDIDPPILFADDWNVPIVDNMLPAHQAGVTLAASMKEAADIAARMKDSKGQVALVALDKLPGADAQQEQVCVSLGVKHAGAYRVQSSNVWLIQLGATRVEPQNKVPMIEIKPSATASRITAITVNKKQTKEEIIKNLEKRYTDELKAYLVEVAGREHAGAMDVFKIKDEGRNSLHS